MLKGRILGIFCWICLFSECFLSIRDVVWLWALLVGRLWALLVERLWTLLVERLWALLVGRFVGFACWMVVSLLVGRLWTLLVGRLWAFACRKVVGFCLFLSLFLRDLVCWRVNIVCSKRESSLLEKRKQSARIEKTTSRNRL